MAVNEIYENADGLQVRYGLEASGIGRTKAGNIMTDGAVKEVIVDLTYDNLPTFDADLNNDGTLNGFSGGAVKLPSGSYVKSATLIVGTAFAGGTSYVLGTYNAAGTVIDADGLGTAAELPLANIDAAGDSIECSGAHVAGVTLSADAYLVMAATGTFTAGTAKLVIEYI